MARRIFIEPNLFLNPSLRVMPTLYKTLWIYLLTSCDEVGVWAVDWEIASLACGGQIDPSEAARLFLTTEDASAKPKAIAIHGGRRWFIRAYLDFQYSSGIINNSQWSKSLQKLLEKHGIDPVTKEPISNPLDNPYPNPIPNPLPKGIGQDRIGHIQEKEVVSNGLSLQGGAGGNGNGIERPTPEFHAALYIRFTSAYGGTGRNPKRTSIEYALLAAMDDCMVSIKEDAEIRGVNFSAQELQLAAANFLCAQAHACLQQDTAHRNKRMNPETWLSEKCYQSHVGANAPPPTDKESPSAKIARGVEAFKEKVLKEREAKNAQ